MPLGDPPAKPVPDISDADHEKYRKDFDNYVVERLRELKDLEDGLQKEKETTDARFVKFADQERELTIQQTKLAADKLAL